MAKESKMKCNICGSIINIRKNNGYRAFPVQHKSPINIGNCHGFFEEGDKVK